MSVRRGVAPWSRVGRAALTLAAAFTAAVAIPSLWAQSGGSSSEAAPATGGETAATAEQAVSAEDTAALARAFEGGSAWLTLEEGRIAFERGEPGAALASLLKAKETAGRDVYPEADLLLGDIWRGEGEFGQAERSYKKALDDLRIAQNLSGSGEFDYPLLRFVVLERLADLYGLLENYGAMEEQYNLIVQSDRDYTTGTLPDRIERNYEESGLNKVLLLYRLSSTFAVRAHAELGWLCYKSGRYEKAVTHSIYAVINMLSTVLRELRRADPQYAFSSVEVTLRDAYRRPNTRTYLQEAGIWKVLYYLAAETFALNHQPRAREVWDLLQRSRDAGMYQGLAARQLAQPWVEPPLKEAYRGAVP